VAVSISKISFLLKLKQKSKHYLVFFPTPPNLANSKNRRHEKEYEIGLPFKHCLPRLAEIKRGVTKQK